MAESVMASAAPNSTVTMMANAIEAAAAAPLATHLPMLLPFPSHAAAGQFSPSLQSMPFIPVSSCQRSVRLIATACWGKPGLIPDLAVLHLDY